MRSTDGATSSVRSLYLLGHMQAMHDLTKARAELGVKIERDVRPRAA